MDNNSTKSCNSSCASMKQCFFKCDNSVSSMIARLTLGLVFLPHGLQVAFGMFGGYGFDGTMGYFASAGLPWIIGFLVIFLEFVGSIALILGFAGRFFGLSYVILLTGMILTAHLQNGFFMNWFGNQAGEGFEYHLLAIGLALIVAVSGSGKFSVDKCISNKCCSEKNSCN